MIESRHPWTVEHVMLDLHSAGACPGCAECAPYADDDDTLAREAARSGLVMLAGAIVTGTALAALHDAAGTAAIVVDLFRWWLL